MSVLSALIASSQDSVEHFETSYFKLRGELAKQESMAPTWLFIIPIHQCVEADVQLPVGFAVQGVPFDLQHWSSATSSIEKEKLRYVEFRAWNRRALPAPQFCITSKARGIDARAAWGKVGPAFETFRGITELFYGFSRSHHSSPPSPARRVPHPPWMLMIGGSGGDVFDFTNFLVSEADKQPPSNVPQLCNDLLQTLSLPVTAAEPNSPNDIRSLIGDALRLYSQAMDTQYDHFHVLALWQMAESLTLASESGGDGKIVARRLASLLKRQLAVEHAATEDILLAFYERRNVIVHKGEYAYADQSDSELLRWSCELCLDWIIEHVHRLATKTHLSEFYKLACADNSKLPLLETALSLIKEDTVPVYYDRTDPRRDAIAT